MLKNNTTKEQLNTFGKYIMDLFKFANTVVNYNGIYYDKGKFIIREGCFDDYAPLIDSYNIGNLEIKIVSELGREYKTKSIYFDIDLNKVKFGDDVALIPLQSTNPNYAGYNIVLPNYLVNKKAKTFKLYNERPYLLDSTDKRLNYYLKGKQIALLFQN